MIIYSHVSRIIDQYQAEKTPPMIANSVSIAGELTEARLKALIKINGGPNSMPKKKAGSTEKLEKGAYATALVGVLRARNDNDFEKVVQILESELAKGGHKKGFGF
jgi:hypothetical protein